jgi:hypothetical protein
MSEFQSECPPPPSYYKYFDGKSDLTLEKPNIPSNFSATEQYNKLFPPPPEFPDVSLDGDSVRAEIKSLLSQLLSNVMKPCLSMGQQATSEKQAKLSGLIDEIYTVLKALRSRQAYQQVAAGLRTQIEALKACETDLQAVLAETRESLKGIPLRD